MTLLLKKLSLMSISMKNGKKPEMQHPASENMQQGLAVPWPISHQPLVEVTKGAIMTGQCRERKKDKKARKTQARRQGNNLFPGPRKTLKK